MKYEYKKNEFKTSTGRRWFKRTLKRSERAKAQEEVQSQVNELFHSVAARDPWLIY